MDPLDDQARLDVDNFEPEAAVSIFMDLFKLQALLEGEAPGCGGCDVSEIAYEEHPLFIHPLLCDAFQLAREKWRLCMSEIDCQSRRA